MITFSRNDGLDRLSPAHRYYAYCIAELALEMPVSGVFYKSKILTEQDIYEMAGVPEKYCGNLLRVLFVSGWIDRIRQVYYLKDLERFIQKPVLKLALTKVKVLIEQFSPEELKLLRIEVAQDDSLGRKLDKLYGKFRMHDQVVIQDYIRSFMTKNQVEKGISMSAMGKEKHIKLLEELLDMYSTGSLLYGGKIYSFNKSRFIENVRMVANRKMTDLKNHNYLKKVLMNGKAKKFQKNVEGF